MPYETKHLVFLVLIMLILGIHKFQDLLKACPDYIYTYSVENAVNTMLCLWTIPRHCTIAWLSGVYMSLKQVDAIEKQMEICTKVISCWQNAKTNN